MSTKTKTPAKKATKPVSVSVPASASSSAPVVSSVVSSPSVPVDVQQLKKAIVALYGYITSRKDNAESRAKQLFDDDEFILLQIQLKKIPGRERSLPYRIPLQHSIYDEADICVITKDPQETYDERKEKYPVSGLSRVLSVTKLRKEFHQYKDKRDLLHSHDLFLADRRVIPLLQPLIGAKFFEAKKQPAAIEIRDDSVHADWSGEIEAAKRSTYLFIPSGVSIAVKVARASFSRAQTLENILSALPAIVERLPRQWNNVQQLMLRTKDSQALPFYASLPFDANLLPESEREALIKQERKEDIAAGLWVQPKMKTKRPRENEAEETENKKKMKQQTKETKNEKISEKEIEEKQSKEPRKEKSSKVSEQVDKSSKVVSSTPAKSNVKAAKQATEIAQPEVQTPAVAATPATKRGQKALTASAEATPAPATESKRSRSKSSDEIEVPATPAVSTRKSARSAATPAAKSAKKK